MKPLRWLRRSLAARLSVVYGLLSVLVVAGMGLGIYIATERHLARQDEEGLAALADFYAAYTAAAVRDEAQLASLAPRIASFFAPQADYDVRLFSGSTGGLLAATRNIGLLPSTAARAELGHRWPSLFLFSASQDRPGRIYAARSVAAADGSVLAVVEVSRDVSQRDAFLRALRIALAVAGGTVLLAVLAASLLLARQMARPLREMEAATQAISAGDFSRRLALGGEDEIGRLAAAVNTMAAELDRLEGARRDFIAQVSHDLRTPLTAIKGFVVNLQDTAPEEMQPALATMDEQADRLIRLVNDLLFQSRLQKGEFHLRATRIDLQQVVRAAVDLVTPRAERLGVRLCVAAPGSLLPVVGDADRLQQVLVNLLDNALRASPAGGAIHVELSAQDQEVVLRVCDEGQGLTAEEQARAFEPYFRGEGGGSGLGLTIAREIVLAHGGRIWLAARPGGGTEAGFALPSST
ncbi:MAG: ATP-binding protein [Anaerolineae bacterium]|nr:ATP-binding protein [Anaerolineae bacterium]